MKNLVFVVNIFNSFKYVNEAMLYDYSISKAKSYAKKYNADFVEIKDCSLFPDYKPYWQRFAVFTEIFEKYDNIIHVDADLILCDGAPNLFEIMENSDCDFAASGDYQTKPARKASGYFNAGLMYFNRTFLEEWDKTDIDTFMKKFDKSIHYDQCCLNSMVKQKREKYFQLDRKWNTMKSWEPTIDHSVAYGIHYIHVHKKYFRENIIELAEENLKNNKEIFSGKEFYFPDWYRKMDFNGIYDLQNQFEEIIKNK